MVTHTIVNVFSVAEDRIAEEGRVYVRRRQRRRRRRNAALRFGLLSQGQAAVKRYSSYHPFATDSRFEIIAEVCREMTKRETN